MSIANSHLKKGPPKGEIHTGGAMGNKRTTERVMDNLSHRARILEKSLGGGMDEVPTCRRQSWSCFMVANLATSPTTSSFLTEGNPMTHFYLAAFQVNLGQPFPPQFLANVNPRSRLLYMLLPNAHPSVVSACKDCNAFDIVSMPFSTLAMKNFT